MNSYSGRYISGNLFDRIRLDKGADELKDFFGKLVKEDSEEALKHLNDPGIYFGTLFILRTEIIDSGLHEHLSAKNRKALEIADGILKREMPDVTYSAGRADPSTYSFLKWIFSSGYRDDGLDDNLDEILELDAAVLIKTFKDISILPQIAEMIFNRNRKGLFIHHLVWAFFEARFPNSLVLLANRLCSGNAEDARLALKLLGFIPALQPEESASAVTQYNNVLRWISGNMPFLQYTGESFHQGANPMPYVISYTAKYLGRPVCTDNGEPLQPLSEYEKGLAARFNQLDDNTKEQLSNFSYSLYRLNTYQWNNWLTLPLAEQARIAGRTGVSSW